jgi:hypothetical protein
LGPSVVYTGYVFTGLAVDYDVVGFGKVTLGASVVYTGYVCSGLAVEYDVVGFG